MKYITLTIILIITTLQVISANFGAPIATCVEVHENGEVTVFWRSTDAQVMQFEVFYSSDGATWFQGNSVDITNLETSYKVGNQYVNANNQSYSFYVRAIYPNNNEVDSQVLSSIFLFVDNSTDGIATLLWDHVSTPLPEGSADYYSIFATIRRTGIPDNWYLITDDFPNTLYNYIIPNGLCADSVFFKIEIENSYGCSSVSNVSGNFFSEDINPDKPVFDSVSIYNIDQVILGWEPSTSPDAWGTVIYSDESGVFVEIDTVFDNSISQYIDTRYNACSQTINYAIAAIDSCEKLSVGTFLEPLHPIKLHNVTYDLCSAIISLTWDSYINSVPDIESYQIWVSTGLNQPELLYDVSGTTYSYDHPDVATNTEYHYFVRAIFGNFSSTSCVKSITTGNYIEPSTIYLANANVEYDNSISLNIDLDLQPNSCTWDIYRSDAGGGNEFLLTSIDRNEIVTSPYSYHDETVDGSLGYYTYSIDVFDSCGRESLVSNTLKTIYLEGIQISDVENNISWNKFEGWDSEVSKYNIFRFSGTDIPDTPIDYVDNNTLEYIDNIGLISTVESKFTYFVQAVEANVNTYGYKEKSNSNMITFFRDTDLYMPNAFRPDGINNTFKPVTTGFGGSNYLFQIYNRWGQLIFESNDPDKGWDGTYEGNKSPQGTYIYRLVYSSVFGDSNSQKGSVTLID